MNIITQTDTQQQPAVVTIGFFDGVHRGHHHLISEVRAIAAQRQMTAIAVTFDAHPRQVLQHDFIPQLLSTPQEKLRLLANTGIDQCCMLHFDRDMAQLSAHDFMQQVLRQRLNARILVTGYDNRFGHNRTEGFSDYVEYGKQLGIDVVAGTPYQYNGMRISSSLIRKYLAAGDIEHTNQALGYAYTLSAPVTSGYAEGRRMGFRTANLDMTGICKMLPAHGAYATRVRIDGQGEWLAAMTNVGTRPTFYRSDTTIETFIFDFNGNLYGHTLEVAFCHYLREEKQFAGEAELTAQLSADEQQARQLLTQDI